MSNKEEIQQALNELCDAQGARLMADVALRRARINGVLSVLPVKRTIDRQYLYFITCGDAVKIGRAIDPQVRMRELQTGAPGQLALYASFEKAGYLESECHNLLADQRLYGEWFLFDEKVIKIINAIRKGELA